MINSKKSVNSNHPESYYYNSDFNGYFDNIYDEWWGQSPKTVIPKKLSEILNKLTWEPRGHGVYYQDDYLEQRYRENVENHLKEHKCNVIVCRQFTQNCREYSGSGVRYYQLECLEVSYKYIPINKLKIILKTMKFVQNNPIGNHIFIIHYALNGSQNILDTKIECYEPLLNIK